MARTSINRQDLPGAYADSTTTLSKTSGDTSNGMELDINPNGRVFLLVHNTDTSAHTFDLISTDSAKTGRQEDITGISVAADDIDIFGPFEFDGWDQGSQNLHIDNVANSSLEFVGLIVPLQ